MIADKKIARAVGSLFLISMAVSLIYVNVFSAILDAPLTEIYSQKSQVLSGALLELINCFTVVGIAVMLFPILKRHSETLARFYLGLRTIESAVLIGGVISGLLMINLSQEVIKGGTPDASYFLTIGALAIAGKNMALQMAIIVCSLGGLMLTYLMYQTKLILRFISAWGFIGYGLVLAGAVLALSGIIDTTHGAGMVMYLPGGLFESILLPGWLLGKGFNSSATASGTAKKVITTKMRRKNEFK